MTCQLPSDGLDALFRCPATGKDLALKHCIRRQDEHRVLRDAKGNEIARDPVRTECVSCTVGADNRAMVALARPAAEAERQPTPQRATSTVLWNGQAPDVPLGPPPGVRVPPRVGLAAPEERQPMRLYRAGGLVLEKLQQVERNQEPAEPAREIEMGKPCTKCGKELVDWNKSGVCGDRGACGRRAAAAGGAPPKERAPQAARVRAVARPGPEELIATLDLEAMSVAQLLDVRGRVVSELKARRERVEHELQELQAAVG